ncbi:YrrS family protein [Virgibacillus sp. W0430]|uniref:YrrS family protein n=1 Tax=Virgibacillus sp. W0430 TaxID=3391580 RepID=UPI003F48ED9D
MSAFEHFSRVDKFEKRRKNKKAITVLLILGIVLSIVFVYLFLFGEKSNTKETHDEQLSNEQQSTAEADEQFLIVDDDDLNKNEDNGKSTVNNSYADEGTNYELDYETIETNDENVIEAYKGNWEPIGTVQEEPHTVQFKKESEDWAEMESAISIATGISKEEMVTYWIGNAGDQKAIGTVYASNNESDIYRVTIEWVEHQGWKPILVEKLKQLAK